MNTRRLSISVRLQTCRQKGWRKECRGKANGRGSVDSPRSDRQAAVMGLGAFSGYHRLPQLKHTY